MNGPLSPSGTTNDQSNRKRVTLNDHHAVSSKKLKLGPQDLEDPNDQDEDRPEDDIKLEVSQPCFSRLETFESSRD